MKKGFKDASKYSGDIICPHCGGIRINKFGKRNNKQRYIKSIYNRRKIN